MSKRRLKVVDCDRKEILGEPSGAVHIWFTYYMNENEAQESWLSLRELKRQTKLDRKTIIKWRDYLIEHRYLRDTGKTAADKYHPRKRRRGANRVHVLSVDDPNSQSAKHGRSIPPERGDVLPEKNPVDLGKSTATGSKSGKTPPSKNSTQPSSSGSGSGSISDSCSDPSLRDVCPASQENQNQNQGQPQAQPDTQPVPTDGAANGAAAPQRKTKCAPDGTPYPANFDAKATANASRIAWVWKHTPVEKRGELKYAAEDWLCAECDGIPDWVCGNNMFCNHCLPPDKGELERQRLRSLTPKEFEAEIERKYQEKMRKDEEQRARSEYLRTLLPGTPEYEAELAAIHARHAAEEEKL